MEDESSVDRLQRKLYARGEGPRLRERRALHEDSEEHDEKSEVSQSWLGQADIHARQEYERTQGGIQGAPPSGVDEVPAILRDKRAQVAATEARGKARTGARVVRSIFFTSLIFFILSAGVAGYFFFTGGNQISCENLDIDVTGPLSIPSGKELALSVGILNKNPTAMQLTELLVQYPEGTRSADNTSQNMPSARERIGTIDAGERVRTTARSVLYGTENSEHEIMLKVEYRIEESNAVFTCEAPYKIIIATAPVSVSVSGLEEVSSGQELALEVQLTSNADTLVPDLRLAADYPFGFEFLRADPQPSNGSNVWDVGDMAPGDVRTIKVFGTVNAPTVEAQSIKFRLGAKDESSGNDVASIIQVLEHPFLITSAFLELSLLVNDNESPEVPVDPNEVVQASLLWKNTLPYPIYDVEIEAKLDSPLINITTVRTGDGYFRSVDRTILWSRQTSATLADVKPGQNGRLAFTFRTQSFSNSTGALDPSIPIAFTARARRVSDGSEVQQTLVAQSRRTIQLQTELRFAARAMHEGGPFVNTGVHPPVPDSETTYTVVWSIVNTTSEVDQAEVTGVLPVNVRWLDTTAPSDGSITYNPTTHVVTWRPGTIPPGTGSRLPAKEGMFQVGILPSITDSSRKMPLVTKVEFTGVDRFTGNVLEQEQGVVDTSAVLE